MSVSSSLAQHLREDDTSISGLRLQTTGGQRHDEWLYTLGIALLWAASAVDERAVKRPRSAKLADIAERLGVPPQLTPAATDRATG